MSGDKSEQSTAAMDGAKRAWAAGDLSGGIAQLERAVALENAEAITQLAHFVAAGVNQKADWDRSIDLLRQGADLGWAPALRELHLLARGIGYSPGQMRSSVDIRTWVQPRPTEIVSQSPRIRQAPGFMSADECAWMIERGKGRLKLAEIYDDAQPGTKSTDLRSNSSFAFDLLNIDMILVLLHARMANTIGLPSHLFEPTMLLHYAPGQQFAPHFDFLDAEKPGLAADIQRRGQRIATFLTYLNEDYGGGETDFPRVPYRFRGRTGDALMFANVDPSGAPDQRTLHAGLPPTHGEKWLLSQWVRDRPSL